MLNEREKKFMAYWEANRDKEGSLKHQLLTGLPLGAIYGLATPILVFSGIFKLPRANFGFFVTMLVATFFIIVFISLFNKKFKYERNNDAYKELAAKLKKEQHLQANPTNQAL
jgi:hypothetical protein